MPKQSVALLAFNRGRVSPLALARTDIRRVQLSAETQTNWMPRTLGSMMLRPGLGYLGASRSNLQAKFIDFIYANDDTALIEVTNTKIRVWIDDVLLSRPAVTAVVANGDFNSDLAGWTDADEGGADSTWNSFGYMQLVGTGENAAIRRQEVTVNQLNTEHGLRILVRRGPVMLKIGSTAGDDDYLEESTLLTGEHSLSFTPTTGSFHIELSARGVPAALVESVQVEGAGVVEITSPWLEDELDYLRWVQSADVVFVACDGVQQHRIERRGTRPQARGWSVVVYTTGDGPFRLENDSPTTLTPSGLSGDITIAASKPLFRSTHVGALFRITSTGQTVEQAVSSANVFTDAIRITGVGENRAFGIIVSGTFSATWVLQRSVAEEGNWQDVPTWSFTDTGFSGSYDDDLDNQIVYYRVGVKTGAFTSGTLDMQLNYSFGSISGVARITGFTDRQNVTAAVLTAMGNTTASSEWAEGAWSDMRGWPSAVVLHEGRLFWIGKDKIWGSVSDAFDSFDEETEGDSGPLSRSIGSGPVDSISWALSMSRLLLGAPGGEYSVRSSALDEPLTPTNFAVKRLSTIGSHHASAQLIDSRAVFIQRDGHRLHELSFSVDANDYVAEDLSKLVPEIGEPHLHGLAIQRQPDTRVHCFRENGTVAVLVFDPTENVTCWLDIETDGEVEDAITLPGDDEDRVYYLVKRTVDGEDVRYLERWALESECVGGTVNKQADSFVTFTNSPASATVSGLDHLEGEDVVVWADGKCLKDADGEIETFTVASGAISLTNDGVAYEATTGVVGLPYTARYKSTKLAYAAGNGTALTKVKKIDRVAMILANTHAKGLKFGQSFDADDMNSMPDIESEALVDPDSIWGHYDEDSIEFPGDWNTDARLCLEAKAPRPATMLACVLDMETNG